MANEVIEVDMERLGAFKRKYSLAIKLILLLSGIAIAYVSAFFFSVSIGLFSPIVLWITFLLFLIFFYVLYLRTRWSYLGGVMLVVWIFTAAYIVPEVTDQMLIDMASKLVLKYPNAELVDISYSPSHGVQEAVVSFKYRSENSEVEYPKVKDFFKENIDQSKWEYKEFTHEDGSLPLNYPLDQIAFYPKEDAKEDPFLAIIRNNDIELLPDIYVTYVPSGEENPIRVSAHF